MEQVKILTAANPVTLEQEINTFISNQMTVMNILNIEYSVSHYTLPTMSGTQCYKVYSALIHYMSRR